MNKGVVIGAIVVVVVVVGAYVLWGQKASAPSVSQTTMATSSQPSTLRELAMSGTPQKCTFTSANNTQGTIYVAGGKVRGDFSSQVNGKAMAGHMIVQDQTSYVWIDGMATGFKNSFAASATTSMQASSQGVNPDEHVSYSCQPWSVDANLFSLPAGVTFSAVGSASVKAGASAVGASCGQCDMIPDAGAKAQCKAALHC
jgi:hypothetical protein